MLFICETYRPQKYLLRITLQPAANIFKIQLDVDKLQQVLSELILLPRNGRLDTVPRDDKDILVLIWNFTNCTVQCSNGTSKRFLNVPCSKIIGITTTAIFEWSCYPAIFIIKPEMIDRDATSRYGTLYPHVSEYHRVLALFTSLNNKSEDKYTVAYWPTSLNEYYCRFSRGGHLYVKQLVKPPLVITDGDNEEQCTDKETAEEQPTVEMQSTASTSSAGNFISTNTWSLQTSFSFS